MQHPDSPTPDSTRGTSRGLPPTGARQWLVELGYRIDQREHGWSECLLSRGDERWLGRGADAAEAFEDALGRALPSHAARALLRAALEGPPAPDPAATGPAMGSDGDGARAPLAEAEFEPFAEPLAELIPEPISTRLPEPVAEPVAAPPVASNIESAADAGADAGPAPKETGAHAPELDLARLEALTPPEPPAPPAAPTADAPIEPPPRVAKAPARPSPRMPEGEALEQLEALTELVASSSEEVALWTSDRQRLQILAWIAAARGVQTDGPNSAEVDFVVRELVGNLGRMTKLWWPGSVRALQLGVAPADCAAELELAPGQRLQTWQEVSAAALRRLEDLQDQGAARGQGERGWADDAYLEPCPREPRVALQEIERSLAKLSGPLGAEPRRPSEPPAKWASDAAKWAHRLRWLRGAAEDGQAWGVAMGRLRWLADRRARELDPLREALSQGHRPALPTWAQYFGFDPEKRAKQRRKKELLCAYPGANGAPREAELAEWLAAALACEGLAPQTLAARVRPHAAQVLALDAEALGADKRVLRRRWEKLKRALELPADAQADATDATDEQDDPEQEARALAQEQGFEERLLARVLPVTRGKRALVVINRGDPDLQRILRETFELAELDLEQSDPRRVQSAAERVRSGTYDLVLSGTGFLSHAGDGALIKACKAAAVPYVRVNRARRQACIRALARELGMLQAAPAAN